MIDSYNLSHGLLFYISEKLAVEMSTIEGQIKHKIAFVEENIHKDVKLILIGHSFGCYLALKMLDQLQHSTLKCLMLFPTIDRLAETPRARSVMRMFSVTSLCFQICVYLFNFFPYSMRFKLVEFFHGGRNRYPHCVHRAATCFLTPYSVKHFLITTLSAMQTVKELEDTGLIEKNHEKLRLYVSPFDHYFPEDHHERFKSNYPDLEMITCGTGHSFQNEDGETIAKILASWFRANGLSVHENGSITS